LAAAWSCRFARVHYHHHHCHTTAHDPSPFRLPFLDPHLSCTQSSFDTHAWRLPSHTPTYCLISTRQSWLQLRARTCKRSLVPIPWPCLLLNNPLMPLLLLCLLSPVPARLQQQVPHPSLLPSLMPLRRRRPRRRSVTAPGEGTKRAGS
jgi:hypothetical protein